VLRSTHRQIVVVGVMVLGLMFFLMLMREN
jgi:hypothetical protein